MKGIEDAGFVDMMQVQEETLIPALEGRDMEVQSQTGTGKTAAFLITIFQHFMDENSPVKQKKALIIAPTRELAVQIEKEAKILGKHLGFTIGSFYGGVGYAQQEKLIAQDVDIIIGTPGRLIDFSQQGKMDFRKIGFLVIDEADRLLDMGFLPDIRRILRRMEGHEGHRQVMLFSATLNVETRSIGREFMNDAATIEIQPDMITVDKITQVLYHAAEKEKVSLMLGILKKEMPTNALIFTNMKHTAAQVSKHLEYNGYKCQYLSGDLPQNKRLQIINKFKEGQLPFLVATDVAARGLHIDDLEMIFNYDLPGDCENYVHRIGRTARAGKSGKAITLACEHYVYNLEAIENFIGMKIPVAFAEDDLYVESKSANMKFDGDARGGRGGSRSRDRMERKKPVSKSKKTSSRKSSDSRKSADDKPGEAKRTDRKRPVDSKKRSAERDGRKKRKEDETLDTQTKGSKVKGKGKGRGDEKATSRKDNQDRKFPDDKKKTRSKKSGRSDKTAQTTVEDRLEYYKKKYGDNFKVAGEPTAAPQMPPPKKKSFVQKLKGIFRK